MGDILDKPSLAGSSPLFFLIGPMQSSASTRNKAGGLREITWGRAGAAFGHGLLRPLCTAFPDIERRDDIFIKGSFAGSEWIAATGYYFVSGVSGPPFESDRDL